MVIGSFLNVCITRIPENVSIILPGSRCPKCGTAIRLYDNVPVFAWIWLGGKCRACGAPISVMYPLVELATRSEERRVGKECGGGWARADSKERGPRKTSCYD